MASYLQRMYRKAFPPHRSPVQVTTGPVDRVIYTFVVDAAPRFAQHGFYLVKSLMENAGAFPIDIHVQLTPQVDGATRDLFSGLGCSLHELPLFGDGKYCNKVGQLNQLVELPFDRVVLLDTDMIVVDDLRPHICGSQLLGKTVDAPIPSIGALRSIAKAAAMPTLPPKIATDEGSKTFLGNCNGGFYVIPKPLARALSTAWQEWALWLLDHIEPLAAERKAHHVDQVSFWLAVHMGDMPFSPVGANLNYFCHVDREHLSFDASHPIYVLHHHGAGLDSSGVIQPVGPSSDAAQVAVAAANALIRQNPR